MFKKQVCFVICIIDNIYRFLLPSLFTVIIKDGAVKGKRGIVASKVLSEFEEIAKQQGVSKGVTYGIKREGSLSLKFSGNIKKENQQRFRNAFMYCK